MLRPVCSLGSPETVWKLMSWERITSCLALLFLLCLALHHVPLVSSSVPLPPPPFTAWGDLRTGTAGSAALLCSCPDRGRTVYYPITDEPLEL